MKPEEIIKYLEMIRPTENYSHTFSVSVGNTRHFGPGSQLNKDVSTAIDLAIQSLQKQVPKKPVYEVLHDNSSWIHCPVCNQVWEEQRRYCHYCGQRINQEETPL